MDAAPSPVETFGLGGPWTGRGRGAGRAVGELLGARAVAAGGSLRSGHSGGAVPGLGKLT